MVDARYGQPEPCVLIAGSGISATALACLLRDAGFGVIMLARRADRDRTPVIEALPQATVRLLGEAGLGSALDQAGAVAVDGFDNATGGEIHRLDGVWVHVDRNRLAARCLVAARRRGAFLLSYSGPLSHPRVVADGVEVTAGDAVLRGFAAVDATGRAARWSRPIRRAQALHATIWRGPPAATARPGRLIRSQARWAYRLDHPAAMTVAVLDSSFGPDHPVRGRLDVELAQQLEITDLDRLDYVASRSAAVQWSADPIGPRRLAVGDAALAYSPLAGHGLRLAIASGFAAAATLRTWSDGDRALADAYYGGMLAHARQRHLAALSTVTGGQPPVEARATGEPDARADRRLYFDAAVDQVAVSVDGRVVPGPCVVLPDGSPVRWVGGVDALQLRAALGGGSVPASDLVATLVRLGNSPRSAATLVRWAEGEGVLVARPDVVDGPPADGAVSALEVGRDQPCR